jgi:hypothetical protein
MSEAGNSEYYLWALDLAALRKAFLEFAQEHKTTPLEWGEHAKLFLDQQRERYRKLALPSRSDYPSSEFKVTRPKRGRLGDS